MTAKKPKYVMTNLVYGATYANLFLNFHLKSLLDETNLPALYQKYDIEYGIFTDDDTIPLLTQNKNFQKLAMIVEINFIKFEWPAEVERFGARYGALIQMFQESVKQAMKKDALCTAWVADLVVAKDFFSRILTKIDEGYGAVFVLPLRSAAESMCPQLDPLPGAATDLELFRMGYESLHPLWVACHWDSQQFSKLPFCFLWNTTTGLLAHSYSMTPIIFKPNEEMLKVPGVIDRAIPSTCTNPYICTDWTDAPLIGVEPLFCYYPPFSNKPSDIRTVGEWSKAQIDPTQFQWLDKPLYYPSRAIVAMDHKAEIRADLAVKGILMVANESGPK